MAKPSEIGAVVQTGLDRIYNDPYTARALDLFESFAKKSLNETSFQEFLNALPSEAAQERSKLEQLMTNPSARVEADLSTRAGQLVWAAGLGFVFQNSKPGTIRSSPIWKTLTSNPQLSGSLGAAARYVDLSITNRNATMDWGTPGSWFWRSPDKNHINIDLFHTLLLGFGEAPAPGMKGLAHATGVMLHEVGHSELSIRYTDVMLEVKAREDKLMAESKTRKLTRDEYKQLSRIQKEFHLRHDIWNAAEDNCVNRYAANQSREFPHDFSESLNVCNVVLQGSGAYLRGVERGQLPPKRNLTLTPKQKEIADAQEFLGKLGQALALSFYTTNGLFETSDTQTWKKLGINPDDIRGMDKSSFANLMQQNVGAEGIANLQPVARDRWLLRNVFARSVESYADRRCKLIDDIWNKYAAPYAQVLIDAAEENAENKLNQKQQQSDGQKDGQGEGQEGQGEGKPGQKGGQNSDDPSPSQGGGSGGQSGDEEQQGGDLGSVDVEGVGKMDIGGSSPSTPEEARKNNRKKSEEETNTDDAKTVRNLAHDSKQEERKNDASNGKDGEGSKGDKKPGEGTPGLGLDPSSGGGVDQRKVDLTELSGGDWKEFGMRINELEPVISRVAEDFAYIRDQQKQIVRSLSKENEQLPRGGDVRQRLDMRAHMNLAAKRATGQKIEDADLQRWRKDQTTTEPTSVELWILGDGSGSTRQSLSDGGRRIDSCLQTMAILYEAGKRASFDVYAGVWENHIIRMLAEPDYPENKIGENFESVKQSGGVGTIYNTPFPQIIDRLAHQTTDAQGRPKRYAGMTHFLWVVDGTKNDLDVQGTASMLSALFRYGPAVSVDIAYMGGYSDCETKQIVDLVKQTVPGAQIDTLEALNAEDAPIQLVRKIKNRFEQSAQEVRAAPDRAKRELFSNAYKAMTF